MYIKMNIFNDVTHFSLSGNLTLAKINNHLNGWPITEGKKPINDFKLIASF